MKKLVLIALFLIIGLVAGCGPNPPGGGPAINAVAGGEGHSLALTSTGILYAWGLNNHGQLGNDSTADSHVPVRITLPAGVSFTALAAGGAHSAALTATGLVYTWGYNNNGQLGIGSNTDSHTPVPVPGLDHVIAISARYNFTVALKDDGSVWAWGWNNNGQLGDNSTQDRWSPVQVRGQNNTGFLANISAIATGQDHTVALADNGEMYAWGSNAFGQLGDCTFNNTRTTPVKVLLAPGGVSLANIKTIAAGGWHTLAQKTNGDVYAWGKNAQGQLSQTIPEGIPNFNEIPTKISGNGIDITGAIAIDAGFNYSVAMMADGQVCGWGANDGGELGIGVIGDHDAPIYAHLPAGVTAQLITAGSVHMIIVTPGGALYDWGSNIFGQLGIGNTTNSLTPVKVNF